MVVLALNASEDHPQTLRTCSDCQPVKEDLLGYAAAHRTDGKTDGKRRHKCGWGRNCKCEGPSRFNGTYVYGWVSYVFVLKHLPGMICFDTSMLNRCNSTTHVGLDAACSQ